MNWLERLRHGNKRQLKWMHRKMDECQIWGVCLGDRPVKCFQVVFTLCSQCHVVFSFTFYVASLFSQASCTSHIYCKLEVYVCIYMCPILCVVFLFSSVWRCVPYVYVCVCVVWSHSSATKCCYVLLLSSCCHRNIVVAKRLLLPRYLISCSLFP